MRRLRRSTGPRAGPGRSAVEQQPTVDLRALRHLEQIVSNVTIDHRARRKLGVIGRVDVPRYGSVHHYERRRDIAVHVPSLQNPDHRLFIARGQYVSVHPALDLQDPRKRDGAVNDGSGRYQCRFPPSS